MLQWQSATTPAFLELWWFDLAWVSHMCVCLCVQRPEVASVYAFHGWNNMAGKQSRGWKEGLGGGCWMELSHGLQKTPQGAGFFPAHRVTWLEGRSQKMTMVDTGKMLRSISEVVGGA